MPPQTFEFDIHKNQVRTNIERQIGNFGRAILEAVQNSVDAGATDCSVLLDCNRAIISDNGKGMSDLETITTCFRVFGQPHTEEEAKIYGAFRMGRGQLFAAGRNIWRTCQYEIVVDYKEKLGFDLHDNMSFNPGCHIEIQFYKPLTESDVTRILAELRRDVRWMSSIKVTANGHELSRNPENSTWQFKNAWYYFQPARTGQLHVYNMGLRVVTYPNSKLGIGGELVSTVPMALISARNDLMDNCPVWSEFRNHVVEYQDILQREADTAKPKAASSRTRRPRRSSNSDRPRDTLQRIPMGRRERFLSDLVQRIEAEEKRLETECPEAKESERYKALLAYVNQQVERLDRQPVFLFTEDSCKAAKWLSYNAIALAVRGKQNFRVVCDYEYSRTAVMAKKSKRAGVIVRQGVSFDSMKKLLRLINVGCNTKHTLVLLSDKEMETIAREEAVVVETVQLSGLEKAVLHACKEAAQHILSAMGVYNPAFLFADLGALRVACLRKNSDYKILIDRDSLSWANNTDGWLRVGAEIIEAVLAETYDKEYEDKTVSQSVAKHHEKQRQAVWWQAHRGLYQFAQHALKEVAHNYSQDIEDSVRLEAAHQLEQSRYLQEVSHRQDLVKATITKMREHLNRIETWYSNTIMGDWQVGLRGYTLQVA
jgi:hypothetical protein